MSIAQFHQPIGFVCCHCRYRSSGSFCSNPDRLDCPHRGLPRCQQCPILFTPSRSNYVPSAETEDDVIKKDQSPSQTKERHRSFDSATSNGSVDGGFIRSGGT
ncbi:hypothetical protein F4805DRAFT_429030 [Annulohypoxylon moriforme]|nr:hypothetical protein F4805DRAFT_429030 [Annulohypoxylon moriforme]